MVTTSLASLMGVFDACTSGRSMCSPLVSNGAVTLRHAGAFVNAGGGVRVLISAADSSLTLPDPNSGISLGATGEVR